MCQSLTVCQFWLGQVRNCLWSMIASWNPSSSRHKGLVVALGRSSWCWDWDRFVSWLVAAGGSAGEAGKKWDRRPSTSSSGRCLLPVLVSACLGILKSPVHPVVKSRVVKQDHVPSCGKVWCLCNGMFPAIFSEMEKNKLFVICPEDPSQTIPQITELFQCYISFHQLL